MGTDPHRGPQRDGALTALQTVQPTGRRLCCVGTGETWLHTWALP